MIEQFVTYDISKKLKDLGFEYGTFARYSPDGEFEMYRQDVLNNPYTYRNCYPSQTLCPLWQQAIDWFLEKHNIKIVQALNTGWEVGIFYEEQKMFFCGYTLPTKQSAILKAIELIKNK